MGRRGVGFLKILTNWQSIALIVVITVLLASFFAACENSLVSEIKYPEINIKQGGFSHCKWR